MIFIHKKHSFIENVHSKRTHRWPTWPCFCPSSSATYSFEYSSLLPGEKCESSSVNLSTSRLSEEGVEGGAWEMSAADAATFNFNLTNSISYEVDLEPLTLCNSARVTFRWVKSAFMKERRKE